MCRSGRLPLSWTTSLFQSTCARSSWIGWHSFGECMSTLASRKAPLEVVRILMPRKPQWRLLHLVPPLWICIFTKFLLYTCVWTSKCVGCLCSFLNFRGNSLLFHNNPFYRAPVGWCLYKLKKIVCIQFWLLRNYVNIRDILHAHYASLLLSPQRNPLKICAKVPYQPTLLRVFVSVPRVMPYFVHDNACSVIQYVHLFNWEILHGCAGRPSLCPVLLSNLSHQLNHMTTTIQAIRIQTSQCMVEMQCYLWCVSEVRLCNSIRNVSKEMQCCYWCVCEVRLCNGIRSVSKIAICV